MSLGESNPGARRVRIGGPTPVTDAASATRTFAAANGISGDDLSRLCVVVEEWVANLYEHGGVQPDGAIEITLSNGPDGVRIVIVDSGSSFDPRRTRPGRSRPQRGGGAGIDIVREWASNIEYNVSEGRNRLDLLIPLRGKEA